MEPWAAAAIGGVAAGFVASLAMNLYQGATASLFGQGRGDDEPATVKAADGAKSVLGGRPVTQKRRAAAGSAVHYALGAALGLTYTLAALGWPPITTGFGVLYGIALALLLDDLAVPALGWGPWPWRTRAATHAYGLTSHVVFGAVLEAVRRAAMALLA